MGRLLTLAAATGAALACAAVGPAARGEVFVLRSGGRLEAQLLNPQRAGGQPFQVRTADGLTLVLAENTVARVVVKSDVQREYEARLPAVANTVQAQWDLAEWCKEVGLTDERRRHLSAVLALDPDHKQARWALGYSRYGSRWMTQNEFLESRGYKFSNGSWKLAQEIELELQYRERDAAVRKYRQEIRVALENIDSNNRQAANSQKYLAEIRDANAAPALTDIIASRKQPRGARLLCLEVLSRLPPGLATVVLVNVAMDEKDETIRDRCLDELVRGDPSRAAPGFLLELNDPRISWTRHKNFKIEYNWRVNRAAYCLARLGYKEATLDLIGALVTEHQKIVPQGGSSGGGGTPLSFGAGGPNGGMGSFGVGGRPKVERTKLDNDGVRDALAALHPGVNHQFDTDAWKRWYIEKFTTTKANFRRDE